MKYFLKYMASNVMFVAGKPVPFEVLADDLGVIALDETDETPENQALLKALTAAAANKVLGVHEIDRTQYEDLKKNSPSLRFGPLSTPYPPLDAGPVQQTARPRGPVLPQQPGPTAEEADASPVAQEPTSAPTATESDEAARVVTSVGGFVPKTKRVRG
jgi:hypothetical protein